MSKKDSVFDPIRNAINDPNKGTRQQKLNNDPLYRRLKGLPKLPLIPGALRGPGLLGGRSGLGETKKVIL